MEPWHRGQPPAILDINYELSGEYRLCHSLALTYEYCDFIHDDTPRGAYIWHRVSRNVLESLTAFPDPLTKVIARWEGSFSN